MLPLIQEAEDTKTVELSMHCNMKATSKALK